MTALRVWNLMAPSATSLAVVCMAILLVFTGLTSAHPATPWMAVLEGDSPYEIGETVTVRLLIDGKYQVTDIDGFYVWVTSETSTGQAVALIVGGYYPSSQTTSGDFYADITWTFPETGYYRIEASSCDTNGILSNITELQFQVNEGDPEPSSSNDSWYLLLAFASVVVACAFIAAFMSSKRRSA